MTPVSNWSVGLALFFAVFFLGQSAFANQKLTVTGKIAEKAPGHLIIDANCICVVLEGCPCKDRRDKVKSLWIPKSVITNRTSDSVEVTLPGRIVKAGEVKNATAAVVKENIRKDSRVKEVEEFTANNPSGKQATMAASPASWLGDLFDAYKFIAGGLGEGAGYVYCQVKGPSCGAATPKPPKKK